jgi:hypothetical protein
MTDKYSKFFAATIRTHSVMTSVAIHTHRSHQMAGR